MLINKPDNFVVVGIQTSTRQELMLYEYKWQNTIRYYFFQICTQIIFVKNDLQNRQCRAIIKAQLNDYRVNDYFLKLCVNDFCYKQKKDQWK